MGNMQTTEAQVRAAFDAYMQAYFYERDLDRTLDLLSDRVSGFGTGTDEVDMGDGSLRWLFERDLRDAPNPIDVHYHGINVLALDDRTGLVSAHFDIRTTIGGQPLEMDGLRLSLMWHREASGWRIMHKHISMPATEHEEGEAYPLKELERRNQLLQEMVDAKTRELTERNRSLEEALAQVKELSGLLPICSACKRIRDDDGYWRDVAVYIQAHTSAEMTHGICPDCIRRLYPEFADELDVSRDAAP